MRTKNIQQDLENDDLVYIPRSLVKRDKYLQEGDVLVSSANSWNLVGKCCWIPRLEYQSTFGGFTSVLRAETSKIFPRYLYHWFSTESVQALARSFGNQTTNISNLNLGRCLELKIPLPSLPEQRRIVAILDKADALRRNRKRAIELLDSLTQSIFLEMFGENSEQLARWGKTVPLAHLAEIGSGITKGRKTSDASLQPVPYLAVANVQDRRLNLSMVKTIEASKNEIERYRLADGDLLLTEGGDPDKLGRGTLWRDELPVAIHQNHIFRVRIQSEEILPLFLNWLVGSPYGKSYFLSVAKQTTGIASINKTQLSAFPVVLPPLQVQRQFVALAEKIASRSAQLASGNVLAGSLFSSLQHRAFSGQL